MHINYIGKSFVNNNQIQMKTFKLQVFNSVGLITSKQFGSVQDIVFYILIDFYNFMVAVEGDAALQFISPPKLY